MTETLDPDITTAKGGLEYIASSPPHEHGGFHPNTVAIAKDALAEIARLEAEVGRLREENERIKYACDIFEKNSEDAIELEAKLAAAQADNAAMREALEKACGVAVWMSGSADFSPDGKMGSEWPDQRDLLLSAIAVLRGPK